MLVAPLAERAASAALRALATSRSSESTSTSFGVQRGDLLVLLRLLLVDEKFNARALFVKRREVGRDCFLLLGDLRLQRRQRAEIRRERLGLDVELRHNGAEQDRAAHRRERVLGLHGNGRGRLGADPLQGREHLGNHAAARVERGADALFVLGKTREPGLAVGDTAFEPGDAFAGLHEVFGERSPVEVERRHLVGELLLPLGAQLHLLAQRLELLLPRLDAAGLVGLDRLGEPRTGDPREPGKRGHRRDREKHAAQPGASAPSFQLGLPRARGHFRQVSSVSGRPGGHPAVHRESADRSGGPCRGPTLLRICEHMVRELSSTRPRRRTRGALQARW